MKNKEQTTNNLIKNYKQQLFNGFIFNRYKTGIIYNYLIKFMISQPFIARHLINGLVVYYQTPNKPPTLIFDLISINNSGPKISANIETSKPPGIFIINPPEFVDHSTIVLGGIFQIGGTAYE
jgi:hypothetical protein